MEVLNKNKNKITLIQFILHHIISQIAKSILHHIQVLSQVAKNIYKT